MRYLTIVLAMCIFPTVCKSQPSPNTPDPNAALKAAPAGQTQPVKVSPATDIDVVCIARTESERAVCKQSVSHSSSGTREGNPYWSAVSSGVVSGVVTAVTISLFVAIWTFIKDLKLKRKIQKGFLQPSLVLSIKGFGVSIENTSHKKVVIRKVSTSVIPRPNKSNTDLMFRSFIMNFDGYRDVSNQVSQKDELGFVELRPYTKGTWLIPINASIDPAFDNCVPHSIMIVSEHLNLFGTPIIMKTESPFHFNPEQFDSIRRQVRPPAGLNLGTPH